MELEPPVITPGDGKAISPIGGDHTFFKAPGPRAARRAVPADHHTGRPGAFL